MRKTGKRYEARCTFVLGYDTRDEARGHAAALAEVLATIARYENKPGIMHIEVVEVALDAQPEPARRSVDPSMN